MNLLEKILLNLETLNYESYLKKFETLNNLMKFIFKREMIVDESIMKQFCNIISKVCINRKEIKDYFHEEILIVMEEMNFDFLRLLLNSLHRQSDWKQISSNLIYEYIVKCECEIDYEFTEERKKNPWFQGSVGILGILLSCTFVEIYEEIVGEEIGSKGASKQQTMNGIFLQRNKNGRIIGDIEKAKEAMRKYTLTISKHTKNGLEKLFKSICREIMRDLFYVFTQERALRNNSRAQYYEESNEYQMKTVLHCYKNRLYYRELSNLQIFGMLLSPEMFMQAAFEAMKWKPQRFDRTFYKYQKQHFPQQFEQSPISSSSSQKSSTQASSTVNTSQNSSTHKQANQNSNNSNCVNSSHKRAMTYQQPRNFSSFQCSPSSNNSITERDAIQRSNRRATNNTEVGFTKEFFHKDGIEDIQDEYFDDGVDVDEEDLFDLEEKNGTYDESILLKYEFVSEILNLCNIDILNLTNNIQPCFKEDKILINEMKRAICINTFNFQSQISMVNLTNKLESMKFFDTTSLKKIIFNFTELGNNKLLKLKSAFANKYEPMMWRPYSWLDAEFNEKLKEKRVENILGNMVPILEKHVFLSDLPASPTFLKFIRNSFHFLYKNNQILSNILKITYELITLTTLPIEEPLRIIEESSSKLKEVELKNKSTIPDEFLSHVESKDDLHKAPENQDIRLLKSKFSLLRLDLSQVQAIKQFYSQSSQTITSQSPSQSPARAAGVTDYEGFLQSFNVFVELVNKLDYLYNSPKNSQNNIDSISSSDKNMIDSNKLSATKNGLSGSQATSDSSTADQQRKQMLQAKQKEILKQFQNKQKKFSDQNEQILDKSFNTVNSANNNNSGNKSLSNYSHHHQNNHLYNSPYQESLLEQQECVICKTDLGITVIHAYVLLDNLSSHFAVTEKALLGSSISPKFAITGCQHITHQRCHEMGIENVQISKRALSKEDKEAQLETFCTICKSLSNISVVVVDCYFKKSGYEQNYLTLFTQTQNPINKKYLSNLHVHSQYTNNTQNNSPKSVNNSNSQQHHPRTTSFSGYSSSSHPSSAQQSSSSSSSNSSTSSSTLAYNNQTNHKNNNNQRCKSDFKDNTKKILDGLVHSEIVAQDKTIVNQIYQSLEEFLSLLAIISNNEDNIQEQYIYNVGDSLLQSLLEKVLLTQNMENYFEKDYKLLDNLYLNLKVIFKGYDSEQQRLKYEYLNLSIQKILETDFFNYAINQLIINCNNPGEQISFCLTYISIIFRIAVVYGEEQAVLFSRDFLQYIFLIFSIKELIISQKSSYCKNFLKQKNNEAQLYTTDQMNILFEDIKSLWTTPDNVENKENIQIACIPYLRMISVFIQLVSNLDSPNSRQSNFSYPKNNFDPIEELEKYETHFGKYFVTLDLEFAEHTFKENTQFTALKFLRSLHQYYENEQQQITNFFEFDKKIFKLTQINPNFEAFYKEQFWKKCQIDFNFPQIEKSPLIMCLICGVQMADNCQRGIKIIQNDVNHAHVVHKGYCVYIQLQDGLLIYVEKDSVQTSQSLFFDKLGRMANCLNYPEWDEFQLDKTKFQEVEDLVVNRKLANHVRYILMQTEDDYAYFDEDYPL